MLILGAIVVALLLRKRAAPDAARLLPNADAILYVNLEPIRLLTDLGKHPPKIVNRSMRSSSSRPDSNLNAISIARLWPFTTHKPRKILRKRLVTARSCRRIRQAARQQYLRKLAKTVERYNDFDFTSFPSKAVRCAWSCWGRHGCRFQHRGRGRIHGMVDRYKQAALPFAGPELVHDYYARVPLGSVVWTVARILLTSAPQDRSELLLPGSWSSLLPRGSVVIASARPLNEVHLRALVITKSETEARNFSERVNAFLALFKTIDISLDGGGPDPDVKKAFDSFAIHQDKNEAVLTASVPFAFFQEDL